MRITSQPATDLSSQKITSTAKAVATTTPIEAKPVIKRDPSVEQTVNTTSPSQEGKADKEALKEKLLPAIDTMNELLETTQKSSKFILHEGLDKYYVRLVDAKTEEVIKEIPPQRLLDAFYEMQKMAGMIVDEKI